MAPPRSSEWGLRLVYTLSFLRLSVEAHTDWPEAWRAFQLHSVYRNDPRVRAAAPPDDVCKFILDVDKNADFFSSEDLHEFRMEVDGHESQRSVTTKGRMKAALNLPRIHISSFTSSTPNELCDLLPPASASSDGLVVDLRGNAGGSLRGAVDSAGIFLPPATSVAWITTDFG